MKLAKVLIVEDDEVVIKENKLISIEVIQNMEEAINKLNSHNYDHVITDLVFPSDSAETGEMEYEIDFKIVSAQYGKFLGEFAKKAGEDLLIKLIKSCENENKLEFAGQRSLDMQTPMYCGMLFPWGAYEYVRESVLKGIPLRARHINGIKIANICRKRGIPYTIYTSDWSHSWPGTVKVAEEGLADPLATLAAVMYDYIVNYENPGFAPAVLKEKFDLKIVGVSDLGEKIIITPDEKFVIGSWGEFKNYNLIIEKIIIRK